MVIDGLSTYAGTGLRRTRRDDIDDDEESDRELGVGLAKEASIDIVLPAGLAGSYDCLVEFGGVGG